LRSVDRLREPCRPDDGPERRAPATATRKLLVAGEVALTTGVVLGALLLVQTFSALSHVKLGFEPDHVLTMRTNLPLSAASPYNDFSRRVQFYSAVLEKVEAIPGVQSAGYTTFLPLTNRGGSSGFTIEGQGPLPPGRINDANHRVISDQYLQTMGVHVRGGRFFERSDGPDSRPVATINEAMAREYFPGQNPLEHRIQLGGRGTPWITIRWV
jgi:putative ABC transport system permease protein